MPLTGQGIHHCHGSVEIDSTYGVPYGFGLLGDRSVLLGIKRRHKTVAFRTIGYPPDVEEFFRHIQIESVTRYAVEFTECQFDLLMSRRLHNRFAVVIGRIAFEKDPIDVSGVFNGYIQESSFARGLIISCRSLVKVPNVVKFMAIYDLRIGLVAYPEWIETTTGVAYEEVPVFLLSPADDINQ